MSEKLKALIVHSDPEEANALASTLNSAEFEVEHAPHGPAAFAAMFRSKFDLVVTDMKLKRLDGFHVIEAAKKIFASARIILLSGHVRRIGVDRILSVGRKFGAHEALDKTGGPRSVWKALTRLFPGRIKDRRKTERD
jgi:DNA-binding response OmpR family regulator